MTSLSSALPSIWQQPNHTREEHEEADTGEGESHPKRDTHTLVTPSFSTTAF